MKRYITIIIFLLLTIIPVMAQVSVEVHLDSARILMGNQTGYSISITSAGRSKVQMPKLQVGQEIVPGIEIIALTRDTTEKATGSRTICSKYTLTSFNGGKYEIPSQTVKVDGKVFTTRSVPLVVDTLALDRNGNKLYPMADVVDNPFSWWEWLPIMLLGLLLIIVVGAMVYFLYRLKTNKPILVMVKKERILSPYEKAVQQITNIKAQYLELSVDQKAYYTSLTDVLRQYLEGRFGINAKEMTSDQIIYQLSQQENRDGIEELKEVFQIADLVKFAKYSVEGHENDLYMQCVVQYIERTKEISEPVNKDSESVLTEGSIENMRWRRKIKIAICVSICIAVIMLTYIVWRSIELIQ